MANFLIIDGYNVMNAWSRVKAISDVSLEQARNVLIDKLTEYYSFTGTKVIIVFDAYQVKGTKIKLENINGVDVVFTKEHQTADSYIEIKVEELTKNKKNIVRVVTSDWAEQQMILGSGGIRITPREFEIEIKNVEGKINKKIKETKKSKLLLSDQLDDNLLQLLEKWRKENY